MKKKDAQKNKSANKRTSENPGREDDTIKGAFLSATAAQKKSKLEAKALLIREEPKVLSVRLPEKNSGSDSTDSFEPVQTKEIQLFNFKFNPQSIKIACNTKIRWIVKENVSTYESGVYTTRERFFIISMNELGIESDPLYAGGTFEHTFTSLGSFEITCANYPGIKGVVEVVSDLKDVYNNLHANYKDRYLFVERRDDDDNDNENEKVKRIKTKKQQKIATNPVSKTDSEDDCCLENRKNLFEIEPEILKKMINNLSKPKEGGPQSAEKKVVTREEEKEKRLKGISRDSSNHNEYSDYDEGSQDSNSETFLAQFFEKTPESINHKEENGIKYQNRSHDSISLEKVDDQPEHVGDLEQTKISENSIFCEEKYSNPTQNPDSCSQNEVLCFPEPTIAFTDFINKTVQNTLDINFLLNVSAMNVSEEKRLAHESAKSFLQSRFELSAFFLKKRQKNPPKS